MADLVYRRGWQFDEEVIVWQTGFRLTEEVMVKKLWSGCTALLSRIPASYRWWIADIAGLLLLVTSMKKFY